MNLNKKIHRGVNGTSAYRDGVSHGRKAYEHQVASDRHRATAAKIESKQLKSLQLF